MGRVTGLAPSASAAHTLSQSLGVECETTPTWLSTRPPGKEPGAAPTPSTGVGKGGLVDDDELAEGEGPPPSSAITAPSAVRAAFACSGRRAVDVDGHGVTLHDGLSAAVGW